MLDGLDNLSGWLHHQENESSQQLFSDFIATATVPGPSELIAGIESNGGWRKWSGGLDLELPTENDFKQAGLNNNHFHLALKWNNLKRVKDWISNELFYVWENYDHDVDLPSFDITDWLEKNKEPGDNYE